MTTPAFFTNAEHVKALRNSGSRLQQEVEATATREMYDWMESQRGRYVERHEVERIRDVIRVISIRRVFERETKPYLDMIVSINMLAMPRRWVMPAGGGLMQPLDDGLWPEGRQIIAEMRECIEAVAKSLGMEVDSRPPTAAAPAVR